MSMNFLLLYAFETINLALRYFCSVFQVFMHNIGWDQYCCHLRGLHEGNIQRTYFYSFHGAILGPRRHSGMLRGLVGGCNIRSSL